MPRPQAPVWLMGLTNSVFGMYGGVVVISMPQLLSARHVPEGTIAAMTASAGAGVLLGGICGCLGYRFIEPLLSKRLLYLAIGMAGALFTLGLLALARTPTTFAPALIGENVFQALAFTASTAIAFDTIGRDNPLAATTFCLVISASNIPLTYMLFADSWGYARFGVGGSLLVDASLSLLAATALAILLVRLNRRSPRHVRGRSPAPG